jgi:ribonuclease BN (tRNA processing enzyme)
VNTPLPRFLQVLYVFIAFACSGLSVSAEEHTLSLRILGSGGPGYNASRAESSVLVRYGSIEILVDMGNGTLAGLSEAGIRPNQLEALFITHHHLDHTQEFMPVLAGSLLGRKAPALVGPQGINVLAASTQSFYQNDITYRRSNIGVAGATPVPEVREVSGGEQFTIDGIDVRCARVNHTIETIAYRFDAAGKSIVISGDLYFSENLITLAQDVDVLVVDSGSLARTSREEKNPRQAIGPTPARANTQGQSHSTLEELIAMLSAANAKVVILTHLPNKPIDEEAVKAVFATAGINSIIIFAVDGMEL